MPTTDLQLVPAVDPTDHADLADSGATAPPDEAQRLTAFSTLVEAIGDLPTSDDRTAGYDLVIERLRALIPQAESVALLLYDAARKELTFRHADGLPDDVVESWRFGLGQGVIGAAARSGPQCCSSGPRRRGARGIVEAFAPGREAGVDGSPETGGHAHQAMLPGLRSELAVPLYGRDGDLVGVLDLGSRAPDAFDDRQVHWLELVARHLGRTIESSCSHDQAQRLTRNLSLLQEAAKEVTSILDRDLLLERIADILGRLIDYQLFSVMVWDEEAQQLEAIFDRRDDSCHTEKRFLRLGEGLCGAAAALRQPVRVGNVRLDARYVACGDDRVRSELVLPLLIEDRLLGVLDLESYEPDAFSEEHEQLLLTLASNVAIALENAHLYERLKRDEQRLERDLTTAREVQRFLLPRRSPWVPGLQVGFANVSARHLGGDIYDFYNYGNGQTAFAIGDVAGKGTGAALYGSLIVGLLRGGYAADSHCRPGCIMGYLNTELRQLDIERRFLALAFAVYDAPNRSLTLANAGLPYPWLVRDGRATELETGGVPLGAMSKHRHDEHQVDLRVGDLVVFTTDGIDEGLDHQDRPFGDDAVRRVLERHGGDTAQSVADALLHASDRHLGQRPASDDRTVLVLKVTG